MVQPQTAPANQQSAVKMSSAAPEPMTGQHENSCSVCTNVSFVPKNAENVSFRFWRIQKAFANGGDLLLRRVQT